VTLCRAASTDELWIGEMRGLSLNGRRVLLVRTDEGYAAFEDRCAHLGVRLSEGALSGCVLTCRAHQYQYDARNGQGINPKSVRLPRFPVEVADGSVLVDVPAVLEAER
jgi:toluene monooxygenase system ferredoxin subunit